MILQTATILKILRAATIHDGSDPRGAISKPTSAEHAPMGPDTPDELSKTQSQRYEDTEAPVAGHAARHTDHRTKFDLPATF